MRVVQILVSQLFAIKSTSYVFLPSTISRDMLWNQISHFLTESSCQRLSLLSKLFSIEYKSLVACSDLPSLLTLFLWTELIRLTGKVLDVYDWNSFILYISYQVDLCV